MNQSCCSLGFLSQNSLWKLSIFRGYKGIYSRVREEREKTFFCKTGCSGDSLAKGMSREFESRNNWQARLSFLSCSAPAVVTLQLSACFTRVAFWRVNSRESLARSSRENPLECTHTWISLSKPTGLLSFIFFFVSLSDISILFLFLLHRFHIWIYQYCQMGFVKFVQKF